MACRVPGSRIGVNGDCCSLSLARGKREPGSSIVSPAALVYTVCILERGERTMRIAVMGAGGVGGYYGALLARAGHEVIFVARGAHRDAIRANGLQVRSRIGDFAVRCRAESDTAAIGPVDLALLAVKTYDNESALPLLPALVGPATIVLTLQNGVDS